MSDFIVVGGELYHYGVKGMKWGVRKKRTPSEQRARIKKKREKADEIAAEVKRVGETINKYRKNVVKAQTDDAFRRSKEWNDIRNEYMRVTEPKTQKKLQLRYAQSKWELGKAINDLDKMMGRPESTKISSISPKAVNAGKTALKAMGPLMAIGGFVAAVNATGGVTRETTYTNYTSSYGGSSTWTYTTTSSQSVGDWFLSTVRGDTGPSLQDVMRDAGFTKITYKY